MTDIEKLSKGEWPTLNLALSLRVSFNRLYSSHHPTQYQFLGIRKNMEVYVGEKLLDRIVTPNTKILIQNFFVRCWDDDLTKNVTQPNLT